MKTQARYQSRFVTALATLGLLSSAFCQEPKRPFTAADDVGLAQFNWYDGSELDPAHDIKYSPDHRYFVTITEKGRLDENTPEDSVWLFQTKEVDKFIQRRAVDAASLAVPLISGAARAPTKGILDLRWARMPTIANVRWMDDSSGIVFTEVVTSQRCRFHQLVSLNVRTKQVRALTPIDQDVRQFDVRSESNYIYVVQAPTLLNPPPPAEVHEPTVLTGVKLRQILFPNALGFPLPPFDQAGLWAVFDGKSRQVLGAKSVRQRDFDDFLKSDSLSLSPDGRRAIVILGAEQVPETWKRYKAEPSNRLFVAKAATSAYHIVDLQTGSRKLLVNVPVGDELEQTMGFAPRWSADGKSLILPNVFLPLEGTSAAESAQREGSPWVAVLRLETGQLTGVFQTNGDTFAEHDFVSDARFADPHSVVLHFNRAVSHHDDPSVAVFRERGDGSWKRVSTDEDPALAALPVKIEVKESTAQPPMIVGTDRASGNSRVVWDPNPQLKDIELGLVEPIHWTDTTGYEYQGALLRPPGIVRGKRYPLVIQPYAFNSKQYLSYGRLTSGTAARALNAVGIVVVQASMRYPADEDRENEGPNTVAEFESLVKSLSEAGIVDSARVGAMGFSRTVYRVLYDIAFDKRPLAAASISDGVDFGYLQYILWDYALEGDVINGGRPFGEVGLKAWRQHSPEFNLDRVTTPLLELAPNEMSVLFNWEEYAALRDQDKPVDLIMLPPPVEHELSNPANRLNSESLYTEWFDFWLQGHEGRAPDYDSDRYQRWEALCDMLRANNTGRPTFCVPSKPH
jgi:dipeptidyl aminopeptidase/acylaminoacyl peptidase